MYLYFKKMHFKEQYFEHNVSGIMGHSFVSYRCE